MIRSLPALPLACVVLSGCLGTSVPTVSNPSCSWDSSVPSNAASICRAVYSTLNGIARAEQTGNTASIRRLVSGRAVQRRILAHGRSLRKQGVSGLHVVPSITLDLLHPGTVGAGFYLNGTVRGGRVNSPLTVELRVTGGRATVVNDQPGEEW